MAWWGSMCCTRESQATGVLIACSKLQTLRPLKLSLSSLWFVCSTPIWSKIYFWRKMSWILLSKCIFKMISIWEKILYQLKNILFFLETAPTSSLYNIYVYIIHLCSCTCSLFLCYLSKHIALFSSGKSWGQSYLDLLS